MAAPQRPAPELPRGRRSAVDDACRSPRHDAAEPVSLYRRARSQTETRPLMLLLFFAALTLQAPAPPVSWGPNAPPATRTWPIREGDVTLRDFRFRSGESLPEVRIHYMTLGNPHRNAAGRSDNGGMGLPGTGGGAEKIIPPPRPHGAFCPRAAVAIPPPFFIPP